MTPSGIEPAIFRFVAQHFNHCATAVKVPLYSIKYMHVVIYLFITFKQTPTSYVQGSHKSQHILFPSHMFRPIRASSLRLAQEHKPQV